MPQSLNNLVVRAFGAGELSPGLLSRADLSLWPHGARTCRNFLVQRHGGVANRTGTRYVATVKDSSPQPVLLKFVFNATQTYVMEFGAGYVRFFRNGAAIEVSGVSAWADATPYVVGDLVSHTAVNYYAIQAHTSSTGVNEPPDAAFWYPLTGTIYELPTPFLDNLHLLRATQDINVVTLTHKDYPPQELTRTADTTWVMAAIVTAPGIAAPANLAVTAGGTGGGLTLAYVVTAETTEPPEESLPSASDSVANADQPTEVAPVTLAWDLVSGATGYSVYADKNGNGIYGFIGRAATNAFNDVGIAPDYEFTPPQARVLFGSTNNYPHTAAYYQQRRVFGNTHAAVATVWASRTGLPSNFSIRSPLQDDDAVTFTPKGRQVLGIQHLVALKRLLMLTDGGEWIVHGDESFGTLTPASIHPEQEGYSGSAAAPVPAVLGNTVLYTQYLSRVVRDLRLNADHTGFESADLTIFAAHLFKSTVVRMDAQTIPHSIVWCVMSNGQMLGLTYLPESDIYGWHRHDTRTSAGDSAFLDVCVVPEGDEHAVYVLVSREIDGDPVMYIERFAQRLQYDSSDIDDAYFVDCGITYSGASATAMTGLDHLEGEDVYAFTNGATVQGPFTVDSGAITLTTAATTAQIGLRITAQLQTLPLDVHGTGVRDKRKIVQKLSAIVEASMSGFFAGPDDDHLIAVRLEPWQTDVLVEGLMEVNLTARWDNDGAVLIQHVNPTPLTILGLIPQFGVGG